MIDQQTSIKLLQASDSTEVDISALNHIVTLFYIGKIDPESQDIDDAIRLASQAIKDLQTVKRILRSL